MCEFTTRIRQKQSTAVFDATDDANPHIKLNLQKPKTIVPDNIRHYRRISAVPAVLS